LIGVSLYIKEEVEDFTVGWTTFKVASSKIVKYEKI
jgi:hypothetical protein